MDDTALPQFRQSAIDCALTHTGMLRQLCMRAAHRPVCSWVAQYFLGQKSCDPLCRRQVGEDTLIPALAVALLGQSSNHHFPERRLLVQP